MRSDPAPSSLPGCGEEFGLYYKYIRKLLASLKSVSNLYFNKRSVAAQDYWLGVGGSVQE